jgi:branched-chain amino acid transport system permease protein
MSVITLLDAFAGGLLMGGIYAVIATGLTIIFGILKIVNFAHGEFLMLSMYLSYFACTYLGISPYESIALVVPVMFVVGIVCHLYLIKPVLAAPEHIQFLLTFALLLAFQNGALLFWTGDWRSLSTPLVFEIVKFGGLYLQYSMVIAFLSSLVITILLLVFLNRTDYGKAIRACSEEREGALIVGLNVNRLFYLTFGIGTSMAAIAGCLILPFFPVSPTLGLSFTLQCFVIVVLGGLGSIPGALVGGVIVGVTESMSVLFLPSSLKQLVTYALFIAVVCLKPSGLFGEKGRV